MKHQHRIGVVCAVIALATGCQNHGGNAFLGKWNGRFVVESAEGDREPKRNELIGFIQIYQTNKSYILHLNGEQQTIDSTGTWRVEGNQILLQANGVQIDDFGGENKRDSTKRYLPADDVRKAFGGTIALSLADKDTRLLGLRTNIGPVIGRLELTKITFKYTY